MWRSREERKVLRSQRRVLTLSPRKGPKDTCCGQMLEVCRELVYGRLSGHQMHEGLQRHHNLTKNHRDKQRRQVDTLRGEPCVCKGEPKRGSGPILHIHVVFEMRASIFSAPPLLGMAPDTAHTV